MRKPRTIKTTFEKRDWQFTVPNTDPVTQMQWTKAYEIAKKVGRIDSNFSSSIRSVKYAESRSDKTNIAEVRVVARNTILPLLQRSPTLKSIFYFAAESMNEEGLESLEKVSVPEVFDLFDPGEAVAILGLIYLSKRLESKCDAEEWQRLSAMMQVHMELGSLVGARIEALGPGTGMLLGGMRCLGYGFLAVDNPKAFRAYRREMKNRALIFDIKEEIKVWGCSHLQIASILVQAMGFGLNAGLGLGLGMAGNAQENSPEWFNCLDDETRCWQAALAWTECLHSLLPAPSFIPRDSVFWLDREQVSDLRKAAGSVLAKGSSFQWLDKKSDDLSKELKIRLGVIFDTPEEEAKIFEELEASQDYAEL
jgi:hypothetical protein